MSPAQAGTIRQDPCSHKQHEHNYEQHTRTTPHPLFHHARARTFQFLAPDKQRQGVLQTRKRIFVELLRANHRDDEWRGFANHPSDAQLVALARQFFKKFDNMAANPSVA